MRDLTLLAMARDLRARAEEVLARAETFHDADARHKLHKLAFTYVKLAERVEKASGGADDKE
jgi:hypothetical protein